MKKLLFYLLHTIKMKFSASYRRAYFFQQGEEFWHQLNQKLPEAIGSTFEDKRRIKLFKEYISRYSAEKRNALKIYLMDRTRYWHENFSEHTTGPIEEIERKHWQIYSSHLEALFEYEKSGFN